jgi:ATP-dependent Clp protease ATP-binding subunit ClpC
VFEKFTASARNVVVLAQEEAVAVGHAYIGTEHLLLGALRETELSDVDLAEARKAMLALMPGKPPAKRSHIPFTGRAKRVMEGALRQAMKTGYSDITQWHLLLSVIEDPENVAVQVLTSMRVDLPRLRARALNEMPPVDDLSHPAAENRVTTEARLTSLEREVLRLDDQIIELRRRLDEH